jgi:hypothetical protein
MPGVKDHWFTHVGGTDRDRLERMAANAETAIPILEAATRTPAAWNGLTAAQRQEHTRVAIFGLTRLARLLLERLEAE